MVRTIFFWYWIVWGAGMTGALYLNNWYWGGENSVHCTYVASCDDEGIS